MVLVTARTMQARPRMRGLHHLTLESRWGAPSELCVERSGQVKPSMFHTRWRYLQYTILNGAKGLCSSRVTAEALSEPAHRLLHAATCCPPPFLKER